jgi:hypothetical protein
VTTVPDIPVVQLPALETDDVADNTLSPPASIWAVDVPHSRRFTPVGLAALGVVAGVAAMAVGAAAVVSAGSDSEPIARPETTRGPAAPAPAATVPSAVERAALALLAKPSTERVAFRGARGTILAVGSGGRAAILIRGVERAPAGTKYGAWVVPPSGRPVRAARFVGTERAVFLTRPLGKRASVVISIGPPSATPAANRVVALRS